MEAPDRDYWMRASVSGITDDGGDHQQCHRTSTIWCRPCSFALGHCLLKSKRSTGEQQASGCRECPSPHISSDKAGRHHCHHLDLTDASCLQHAHHVSRALTKTSQGIITSDDVAWPRVNRMLLISHSCEHQPS